MDEHPTAPSIVTDLAVVREDLRIPTLVAATLAEAAGATVTDCRPGRIGANVAEREIEIRVRAVNVFRDEAAAYRLSGEPVPPHVIADMRRWVRERRRAR